MRPLKSIANEIKSRIDELEKNVSILKNHLKRLEDCNECYLKDNIYLIGRYPDLEESKVIDILIESNKVNVSHCINGIRYSTNLDFVCLNEAELKEFKIKKITRDIECLNVSMKETEKCIVEEKESLERLYFKKEKLLEEIREMKING